MVEQRPVASQMEVAVVGIMRKRVLMFMLGSI